MKKYIQLVIAVILVAAVVWMAQGGIAWARGLPASQQQPVTFSEPISAQNGSELAPPPRSIDITESGSYNIGGICFLKVEYKGTGVKNRADSEVPVEESSKVPFSDDGKLIFPGCHVVHFKDGEVVREAIYKDGTWEVCFGANSFLETRIYYYEDEPESGNKVWIELPTTLQNGFACTNASFTGVYMPVGKPLTTAGGEIDWGDTFLPPDLGGSVVPPPPQVLVTESGSYSVGGVCGIVIDYYIPGLADDIHVQFPTEDTQVVPFPDNGDILYLPGCHVLHYRDAKIKDLMTREEGKWEICFAALPTKQTTIYFYRDDATDINPPWEPLETTTKQGLACAPLADYSGVYAPAAQ